MRDTLDFSESITGFEEEGLIQLVGVKLGDEEYAIDVLQIQEIIRPVDITVVPRLDNSILGVMNLRGKVVPVIDLRTKFGMTRIDFDKSTRIIVVNFDKQNVGFVVDVVNAVIRISKDMVELTPPVVSNAGKEYILGICKFEDSLIVILDIYRVLNDDEEESHLRKLLLGKPQPKAVAHKNTDTLKVEVPKASEVQKPAEQQKAETPTVNFDLPNPSAIQTPTIVSTAGVVDIDKAIMEELAKREKETEELNKKKRSDGLQVSDTPVAPSGSIDDMIAIELAKREKETEELNKQKRNSSLANNDIDTVLSDALAQGDTMFKDNGSHVEQNDLDSLIAIELAKREKETEELNKRNRESEKKN